MNPLAMNNMHYRCSYCFLPSRSGDHGDCLICVRELLNMYNHPTMGHYILKEAWMVRFVAAQFVRALGYNAVYCSGPEEQALDIGIWERVQEAPDDRFLFDPDRNVLVRKGGFITKLTALVRVHNAQRPNDPPMIMLKRHWEAWDIEL